LRLRNGQRALLRVTAGTRSGKKALAVLFHGAGGSPESALFAFRGGWDDPGVVLVAPAAMGATWSVLQGPDRDVESVNLALEQAFARCRIDRRRVAVGGFSDGASYALSLGIASGRFFRSIMALSPGGIVGSKPVGKPRVFIAHGTHDGVLPAPRTSNVIVRKLRAAGYQVTYKRFAGGHEAPRAISNIAMKWFLAG
jgi:predicted esterase